MVQAIVHCPSLLAWLLVTLVVGDKELEPNMEMFVSKIFILDWLSDKSMLPIWDLIQPKLCEGIMKQAYMAYESCLNIKLKFIE